MGIECMDPEVRREAWAGNGDLNIVNVDMGIEAMGTDGSSPEGTRLENTGLGEEEPEEAWID